MHHPRDHRVRFAAVVFCIGRRLLASVWMGMPQRVHWSLLDGACGLVAWFFHGTGAVTLVFLHYWTRMPCLCFCGCYACGGFFWWV